jgi:hypothetical protein
MSAAIALQTALVAALTYALSDDVAGVFDGPPVRPDYPHILIGEGGTADWSHKTGRGREHRLAIIVRDDGQSAARLHGLMGSVEAAVEAMPVALEGHRIASLVFLRSRVVRDAAGPWSGLIEYRVRTLEG